MRNDIQTKEELAALIEEAKQKNSYLIFDNQKFKWVVADKEYIESRKIMESYINTTYYL